LAEVADLVVNAEEATASEPKTVVRVAFVPLPMLSDAIKEFFSETASERSEG
jgi:hypothetical protein